MNGDNPLRYPKERRIEEMWKKKTLHTIGMIGVKLLAATITVYIPAYLLLAALGVDSTVTLDVLIGAGGVISWIVFFRSFYTPKVEFLHAGSITQLRVLRVFTFRVPEGSHRGRSIGSAHALALQYWKEIV